MPKGHDVGLGEGSIAVHPHYLQCFVERIQDEHTLALEAEVLETLFMGYSTQVTCHVHGHGKVVVRDSSPASASFEPGDKVFVTGSRNHLVFLPREEGHTG